MVKILDTHGQYQAIECDDGQFKVDYVGKGNGMRILTNNYELAIEYFLYVKKTTPAATGMAN